jgi:hypothetical protein
MPVFSKVVNATNQKDYKSLEMQAGFLFAAAHLQYLKIKDLKVSPEMQNAKTNYLLYLEDTKEFSRSVENAAISAQSGDWANFTIYKTQYMEYFNSSRNHLNATFS